ncbi:probable LRR receptor-like serine/threonine-protein kinase At4g36180 [Lycium barbarum]|uniref:probable LRR receptor-like serine/threonine-protein kinase At4g36180 n=1 Tax=Lycium barbarum TaxID=112863 RepID=UPI00293F62E3|nr:probable LRR receptor-like serine/threonine-protein kinase At4g36180 [Lycium barbarum]
MGVGFLGLSREVLDLSNNSLSGTIRRSLRNCKSLSCLNLGQNKLAGSVQNKLAGSVPKELERVTGLRYLDLNGNDFEGSFPTVIENFQELEILNLAGNRFEGRISKFIGDLHHLRILDLASNSFDESIPEGLMKLENLQYIGLFRNNLSGPIPDNLDGLKMMTRRQNEATILGYFYSFKFTGAQLEIVTKGQTQILDGLPLLNLSHNNPSGLIPKTIGEMISLESLDLSYNHFAREIPVTLTLLDFLQYLNLSYNNLSGMIPSNLHFDTLYQDGMTYIGNKYLCGAPGIAGVLLLLYLVDDNWRNRISVVTSIISSASLMILVSREICVTEDNNDTVCQDMKYYEAGAKFLPRIVPVLKGRSSAIEQIKLSGQASYVVTIAAISSNYKLHNISRSPYSNGSLFVSRASSRTTATGFDHVCKAATNKQAEEQGQYNWREYFLPILHVSR